MAMDERTQLSITFRRTRHGEWLIGGDLGVPGREHALAAAKFEPVDFELASFAAGFCAALAGVPIKDAREFGAIYPDQE